MCDKPKASKAQRAFLVFLVLPTVLGFLLYNLDCRLDYHETREAGIVMKSFNTWRAYEHQWCYVVAVAVWFAAIWFHLADPSNVQDPEE